MSAVTRTRLKYVCHASGQYGLNVPAAEYVGDGVRLIRTTDLATGRLAPDETGIFVPEELVTPTDRLEPHDLLLSRSGTIGRAFLVPADAAGMAFAGFLIRFRALPGVSPRFLYYCTQSANFQARVQAEAVSNTIQNFNADRYGNLEVPSPPLDQQRAIADFLDRETARIDTLIEEQQRLIELLRERRMSVITRATGWAGSDAHNWPTVRLSWVFERTASGTTPANDDIVYASDADVPWVTTGELREAVVRETQRGVSNETLERYSALSLHPAGSLLIAMYGATIGRMAILGVDATSNQACCALVGPVGTLVEFIQYSLTAAKQLLLLDAAGGGQPNINQDKVRSFRIPLPPIERQQQIVQILDDQIARIDRLIAETERFIELSKERRAALITAAVTGQIDVREPAGAMVDVH